MIYKTEFKITVLSDGPLNMNGGEMDPFDLNEINFLITEGHCLGQVEETSSTVIQDEDIEKECLALGNDGTFFALEEWEKEP